MVEAVSVSLPSPVREALDAAHDPGRPGLGVLAQLASKGDASAAHLLGCLYHLAAGEALEMVADDPLREMTGAELLQRGWAWKEDAAESGNSEAMVDLYKALAFGSGGLAQDTSRALSWCRRAAQAGEPEACFDLGIAAMGSDDGGESEAWLSRAADRGHCKAHLALALLADARDGASEALRHVLIAQRLSEGEPSEEWRANLGEVRRILSDALLPGEVAECVADAGAWRPALV